MRVQDISAPQTQATCAAAELAASCHSPALINHVVRSWLWAEAFALLEGRQDVDHELLYASAMLHDVGLVPNFDNASLSYEEAGGHIAVALTAGAGWPPDRRQRALDVIVRHNWPSVDPEMDVEGYLLGIATSLDIGGSRLDALPQDFVREVMDAHPRLTLAEEFTAGLTDQAARKPATAAPRLVHSGLATRMVQHPLEHRSSPGFRPTSRSGQ
ncbi:MAG TPA: HD domain-containing protein [Propionibacteriaceae bacterium]|nr:HD domain-containing protein [Propionibacteriaceae bacterium]